jgi:hypothetical protein
MTGIAESRKGLLGPLDIIVVVDGHSSSGSTKGMRHRLAQAGAGTCDENGSTRQRKLI